MVVIELDCDIVFVAVENSLQERKGEKVLGWDGAVRHLSLALTSSRAASRNSHAAFEHNATVHATYSEPAQRAAKGQVLARVRQRVQAAGTHAPAWAQGKAAQPAGVLTCHSSIFASRTRC